MKKIITFTAALFIAATLIGQAPASFKYQAVLRDARGNIKANTATNIIIGILQGSATGTAVYSETHSVTTDGYGLINLELGKGTATIGAISAINWDIGTYFVKVTVDGVDMGTGQLLSVPYALYASKAANGFSGIYNDLTNKPTLFDGQYSSLTGKPTLATVATSGSYNDLTNKPTITNGTVTSITGTAPISVATGTTTPVISMAKANGTTDGYLSSTDWTKFNNISSFDGTWSSLIGKPALATVATSGSFNDLTGTPTTLAGYGITNAMSTSHATNGITSTNITNWNTAYGWGNHAGLYRPIGYVPAWSEITSNPFLFTSVANNQLLKYNSVSAKWENWTPNFLTTYIETDPTWTAASANYYTKTNMQTSGASQLHFNNLTNKPTTVAGYGITDALTVKQYTVTNNGYKTILIESGQLYRLTIKSCWYSAYSRIGTYLIYGLNVSDPMTGGQPTVLTVAVTSTIDWSFTYTLNGTNANMKITSGGWGDQGLLIVLECLSCQ